MPVKKLGFYLFIGNIFAGRPQCGHLKVLGVPQFIHVLGISVKPFRSSATPAVVLPHLHLRQRIMYFLGGKSDIRCSTHYRCNYRKIHHLT